MFARVITTQVSADQIEHLERIARDQLPGAQGRSGYRGYWVLYSEDTSSALIMSLWDTFEAMNAVSAGTADGIHTTGLTEGELGQMSLATYTVLLRDGQEGR